MREKATVSPRVWMGGRLSQLSAGAQLVYFYLRTCPSSEAIGLYYLPLTVLHHESGINPQDATKAIQELEKHSLAFYDRANEVVFVPEMAADEYGESLKATDNRVKGIRRNAALLSNSPLLRRFWEFYGSAFNLGAYPCATPAPPLPQEQQESKPSDDFRLQSPPAPPKAKQTDLITEPTVEPFIQFWNVVHSKVAKAEAKTAFPKAVKRAMKTHGKTRHEAEQYIISRMKLFAASPASKARDDWTPIYPSTWLNRDRYDDDPESWNKSIAGAAKREHDGSKGKWA